MTIDEIEQRKAEIAVELEAEGADLDALTEEVRTLNEERKKIETAAEQRKALRDAVAAGAGEVTQTINMEERKMPEIETRNTKAYIDAYAEYIKTGKDEECRALLSTNGTDSTSPALTGYVPVPDLVDARVRTAWEKNKLLSLCRVTNLKGNVKVGFELSATGAVVHKEGRDAPNEEVITLGIVTMVPESIKKWITISDEALDLSGEEFLNYIYDELTYRIAKKAEEELIDLISDLPATATATSVSAVEVETAPGLTTIATALGKIYGTNFTVVMNRGTWAKFKSVQYGANFALDIFEGQKVVFTDALPAFDDADEGDVYAIVGDFFEGAQVNYPAGQGISIKVDNLSLAEKDLVKFVGRMFVGMGAVADKRFALLTVPENP